MRRRGAFQAGRRGFESRLPLQSHEFRVCAHPARSKGTVTGRPFHRDLCLHSPDLRILSWRPVPPAYKQGIVLPLERGSVALVAARPRPQSNSAHAGASGSGGAAASAGAAGTAPHVGTPLPQAVGRTLCAYPQPTTISSGAELWRRGGSNGRLSRSVHRSACAPSARRGDMCTAVHAWPTERANSQSERHQLHAISRDLWTHIGEQVTARMFALAPGPRVGERRRGVRHPRDHAHRDRGARKTLPRGAGRWG